MNDTKTPLPEEMPDDPAAMLGALGFDASVSADNRSALDAIRAEIAANLEAQQGPHRKRSIAGRLWPVALAALFLGGAFFVLKPAASLGGLHLVASVIAGLAGLLCLCATAMAPDKPGLSERISLFGIVAAGAALCIEGFLAASAPMGQTDAGIACGMMTLVVSLVPLVLMLFAIRRSGLPVRRLHAIGITAAGISIAGASVWMHCPSQETMHLVTGHMAIPALVAAGLSLVLFRLFSRLNKA